MSIVHWCVQFCADTVQFKSLFGFALYWIPVAVCAIGFTLRTLKNCSKEVALRKQYEEGMINYYYPEETIGIITGRFIVIFLPIVNLGIAVCDFGADFMNNFFNFFNFFSWIGRVFDQPLVPKRERACDKEKRK
ncbi:MAG: hypothetical protein PHW03_02900 [Eubacteriales bacterium]|nr:hypothetical protein [Eubacteriales bacterium]